MGEGNSVSRFTFHVSRFTLYALRFTLHALRFEFCFGFRHSPTFGTKVGLGEPRPLERGCGRISDFKFPPFMSNKATILKTVLFLTLIPSISFAIETIYPWSQPTNLSEWVFAIINLFILLGGIAALLSLVLGGIQWISSGVAPEQKTKAKDRVTYAIVGRPTMA